MACLRFRFRFNFIHGVPPPRLDIGDEILTARRRSSEHFSIASPPSKEVLIRCCCCIMHAATLRRYYGASILGDPERPLYYRELSK